MKKVIIYAKFVATIIAIIIAYKVYMELGRIIVDREDDSMAPAVRPGQWVWYDKTEHHVSQLKKDDVIIYRNPKKTREKRIARVKKLPGDAAKDLLPRGYVWVLLDDKKQKPDSRTFGPLHEHFIKGKVIWLEARLPMD